MLAQLCIFVSVRSLCCVAGCVWSGQPGDSRQLQQDRRELWDPPLLILCQTRQADNISVNKLHLWAAAG